MRNMKMKLVISILMLFLFLAADWEYTEIEYQKVVRIKAPHYWLKFRISEEGGGLWILGEYMEINNKEQAIPKNGEVKGNIINGFFSKQLIEAR